MDSQIITQQKLDAAMKPENVWANYDQTSDTLLIYLTGKPVPCSVDWIDDYTGALLDDDDNLVGFQIDHFELVWLPKHSEIAQAWKGVRPSTLKEGWSNMLRMLAAFILILTMQLRQNETMVAAA